MSIAYYNGEFLELSDVRIPLSDRAVFFGDGVYDAAIGKNGKIYLLDEHTERLLGNAGRMDIFIDKSKKELEDILFETVRRNCFSEYFIYVQLTRDLPFRSHGYGNYKKSNLLVTVKEYSPPNPRKKLKVITEKDVRYEMCDVKTLNLLPNVLASQKAESSGCDEAVFIRNGYVTECAHSNVSIIKNGTLFTHPKNAFILPGTVRARLLAICEKLSVPYKETPFTKDEMINADEILITSTSKLCLSVSEIDGKSVKKCENSIANRIINAIYSDYNY